MSVRLVCNGDGCHQIYHHSEERDRDTLPDIRRQAARLGWSTEVTAPGDVLDYCPVCWAELVKRRPSVRRWTT